MKRFQYQMPSSDDPNNNEVRNGWNHLKEKYIVWVGGIDDHFKTKEEANQSAAEWKAKGYTDVIIEKSFYV